MTDEVTETAEIDKRGPLERMSWEYEQLADALKFVRNAEGREISARVALVTLSKGDGLGTANDVPYAADNMFRGMIQGDIAQHLATLEKRILAQMGSVRREIVRLMEKEEGEKR